MKRTVGQMRIGVVSLLALVCAAGVSWSGCKKKDDKNTSTQPVPGNTATAAPPKADPPKADPPAPPAPKPGGMTVEKVGFMTPESALYFAQSDVYLVSNINGDPFAKDDNGFISQVSPDGTVTALKWIDGASKDVTLHAPKGMAIIGKTLYVADIDSVRMFSLADGKPLGAIPVPGATFLNDLYADGNDLYVSDSGMTDKPKPFTASNTDAVWKLTYVDPRAKALPHREKVALDPALGRPNGLLVADKKLWVVTFGSGELYELSTGKKASAIKLPKGALDGIVLHPSGDVLISSWGAKSVYRGKPEGPFTEVISGVEAPADIGWDSKRSRVLIPLFMGNALRIEPLP